MNDLRSRIAAIVERDRARQLGEAGRGGGADTETLSTRETPSLRDGDPSRAGALGASASPAVPFEVFEQRIAIDDLGLEIVGRGAPDPMLLAHLGLKGDAPSRWEDVLWLDTETTGLSGGTGTYVFLLGIAYFCDGELILRQHLLHDIGFERPFVETIQAEIESFRACASYNGKSFDL